MKIILYLNADMEKGALHNNEDSLHLKPRQALGIPFSVRNILMATAMLSAETLSANSPPKGAEIATPIQATATVGLSERKNILPPKKREEMMSGDIWSEYDKRVKVPKTTEIVQEETVSWFSNILDRVGMGTGRVSKTPTVQTRSSIDEYTLSRLGKEYLERNKETFTRESPGKTILLAHYKNPASERGHFIALPIPRANPTNDTIRASALGMPFTLTPYPKSNGYNTEYQIACGVKGDVIQLAVLYPLENMEYKKEAEKLEKFKGEMKAVESQIASLLRNVKTPTNGKKKPHRINHTKKQGELTHLKKKRDSLYNQIEEENKRLAGMTPYTYFSYIPFTERHNTPKNQERGFEYLSTKMKSTYAATFQKKVAEYPSTAPGLSIGQALPYNFPLLLNIVERMDYMVYFERDGITLKNEKTLETIMQSQVARSLTTFGLNEHESFNWQKSPVGAAGVGQIMPKTYQLYRNHEKYRPLFPEPDFKSASQSHDTSFRLQLAHFDDQIYQFPSPIKQNWQTLITDKDAHIGVNAVLAAGYNGSMKRIAGEVFGDLPPTAPLDTYKARLTPASIVHAMAKERTKKVTPLEAEIAALNNQIQKGVAVPVKKGKNTKSKGIPRPLTKTQLALLQGKITKIQSNILAINNTYKESMTYVKKTAFVSAYLAKNYPKFRER